MPHYITLFAPETYRRFTESARNVSGVRSRNRKAAERVRPGDVLIAYMTGVSRWVGLFEVTGRCYDDPTPLFSDKDDPYSLRFPIETRIWLSPDQGLPIRDPALWSKLSFTRQHQPTSATWTNAVRTSLYKLEDGDAALLSARLREQAEQPRAYPLDNREVRLLEVHRVRRADREISVSVPEDEQPVPEPVKPARESILIQALLAKIGHVMSFSVWVPPADRASVLREEKSIESSLLDQLPLNYDTTTLKTIENIDVLWLKGRSMARAFEVEHTTAIYSGILRMADLIALQPNMDIRLHIVAPEERRRKVFEEIRRPVFSLIEGKPLQERCTFLSYDSIQAIAKLPHLEHVNDSILSEYEDDVQSDGA